MYFTNAAEFEDWLSVNHEAAASMLLGFFKTKSGITGVTYGEALDVALCFGWIDGVRKRIDDACYSIRFSPRKRGSIWSAANVARVERLTESGRIRPAGIAAFEQRSPERTAIYSHEQPEIELAEEMALAFQNDLTAWSFFESQAPSYRRAAIWWVICAKQDETRKRRALELIANSAQRKLLPHLSRLNRKSEKASG